METLDPRNIALCLAWYESKGIPAYEDGGCVYIIVGSEMSCDEHHIEVSLAEIEGRALEQQVTGYSATPSTIHP